MTPDTESKLRTAAHLWRVFAQDHTLCDGDMQLLGDPDALGVMYRCAVCGERCRVQDLTVDQVAEYLRVEGTTLRPIMARGPRRDGKPS